MKVLTQRDWLQVSDAAALLGVSDKTLRNWDKAGKLRPVRHPINGYRLYRASDLHRLKRELQNPAYLQHALDFAGGVNAATETAAPKHQSIPRSVEPGLMHWRAEVALDPKHRPQLWDKPSSTVRRDWRKYPQEAHVLDQACQRYRRLTPREIAVLQGFDPELVAHTGFTDRQIIAAIGNAVPPPLAHAVVKAVSNARSWKNRTTIEVCAGIGGLTRGATQAGFEHILCLDIDPVCIEFLHRMPELRANQIDSTDLRYAHLDRFRGQVGLLSGGPPCQPWSAGGLRRGSEDDRDMLGEMPKLVAEIEPEGFVFENVAGLTTGQNKKYFDGLVERFQEPRPGLQYGVLAARFNAADFGVPQIRERVFIVGLKGEAAASVHRCFDQVWNSRSHRDPSISDRSRQEWKTVGAAIEQLGDPGGWRSWFGNPIVPDQDLDDDHG